MPGIGRRAAIVSPVRTAVGTFGGSLLPVRAEDLAAEVIKALVSRSGVEVERIEDVVFAHLASADVGVDTSLQQEVTPVKALEYMAFGLPFACFDLPETRRLAEGAAVLVPPADVEALARAVVDLLGDEGARARLAEVGRRAVGDTLAWERQAAIYLDVVGPDS